VALTTPRTWATSDALDSTNLNTGLRDPINDRTPLWVRKTLAESVTSSTALQNDDELVLALAASATYEVWLTVLARAAAAGATPGMKIDFTTPSGADMTNAYFETSGVMALTAASGLETGFSLQTTNGLIKEQFTIITTNSGNLQFRWAQNASSANATTVDVGSKLYAVRVA
jgi:hypothetical protein